MLASVRARRGSRYGGGSRAAARLALPSTPTGVRDRDRGLASRNHPGRRGGRHRAAYRPGHDRRGGERRHGGGDPGGPRGAPGPGPWRPTAPAPPDRRRSGSPRAPSRCSAADSGHDPPGPGGRGQEAGTDFYPLLVAGQILGEARPRACTPRPREARARLQCTRSTPRARLGACSWSSCRARNARVREALAVVGEELVHLRRRRRGGEAGSRALLPGRGFPADGHGGGRVGPSRRDRAFDLGLDLPRASARPSRPSPPAMLRAGARSLGSGWHESRPGGLTFARPDQGAPDMEALRCGPPSVRRRQADQARVGVTLSLAVLLVWGSPRPAPALSRI